MARVKVRTLEIQFDLDDDNAHTVEQALRRHIKDNLDLARLVKSPPIAVAGSVVAYKAK